MNKNYEKAVKFEYGIDGEKSYKQAYHHYYLAMQEGNKLARRKVKYKKLNVWHILLFLLFVLAGIIIDVVNVYAWQGSLLISVALIIISIVFLNKYWIKNGFAYLVTLISFLFASFILLPFSVIYPYLTGITWIPLTFLLIISFFTAFATLVIMIIEKTKKYLLYNLLGFFIMILTLVSFMIETNDKKFIFIKRDDGIEIIGFRYEESDLIIPDKLSGYDVIGIGDYAFRNIQFKTIEIGNNIRYIGNNAFSGNRVLEEIIIPDGVKLGRSVFADNYNLSKVKLPNDLTILDSRTFYNNFNLNEITLPTNLENIGDEVFKNSGIKKIRFPNTLKNFGNDVFSNTKISNLDFPSEMLTIGSLADMLYLESFNIPKNIVSLPSRFLENNTRINVFAIPNHITSVGSFAFRNSQIENVLFHDKIEHLGIGIFYNAKNIGEIILPENIDEIPTQMFAHSSISQIHIHKNIKTINGQAFMNAKDLHTVSISEGLTVIGEGAFMNNTSLESIVFPNSFRALGENSFKGSSNLKKVVLPEGITTIPSGSFDNATSLEEINLPLSLVSIGNYAFRNTNLTEVVLPETIKKVGSYSFYGNRNLKGLILNEGLERLGAYSFGETSTLETIDIPNTVLRIDDFSFSGSRNLKEITFKGNVDYVGYWAFRTNYKTIIYVNNQEMTLNWHKEWNPYNNKIVVNSTRIIPGFSLIIANSLLNGNKMAFII